MQSMFRTFHKAGGFSRYLPLIASQCPRLSHHKPITANCSNSFFNIQEFLKVAVTLYAQNRYMGKNVLHITQTRKAFYIEVDDARAVLTYGVQNGVMIIKHTRVPKHLGGRGLGKHLAKAALEFALRNGLFLVIKCQFVQNYIEKYEPQYAKYMLR